MCLAIGGRPSHASGVPIPKIRSAATGLILPRLRTGAEMKGNAPSPPPPRPSLGSSRTRLRNTSPNTLRRRVAGIRKIHRLMRLPNPVEDEEVLLAMRRALRTKPRRPKQAYGLTKDLRDKLIAACPDTLIGIRNRAIIAVGYDTLCRRSELVGLRVEDLSKLERGAMSILVRRAKNDPFGDGRLGYLTPKTVKLLKKWLKASNIKEGWLFRRIYGFRIGSHYLHPYTITRTIKELAVAAGLESSLVRQLSGHSMRVGAAQDMMTSGIGILPVMQAGGWRSMNIVGRYVQNASVEQNGIAQLFGRTASFRAQQR
jgi:integrase/recombinase XerD